MRQVLSLAALLCVASCYAQSLDDSVPATTNVRGADYPRVHPDGRVTFKVKAPAARKVQVQPGTDANSRNNGSNGLGKDTYDMARDPDGTWTVTTPPAVPGFHYYWLLIDGVPANDPSSQTYTGYSKPTSGIEIPGKGADFYSAKEVPHGQVRLHWYHSRITDAVRTAWVYTPPGYDANPKTRYPVLYLNHGGGEDETGWTRQGHANFILDNLIAAGKAKPMIVVMDRGYALKPGEKQVQSPGPPVTSTLEEVFIKEIIPTIDSSYRTLTDRDHRAMAGLSMGSGHTLQITCNNLDKFSYIGVFSRAPYREFDLKTVYHGAFADAAAFNKKVHLFYWSIGTAEPAIHDWDKATSEALNKTGIRTVLVEWPGLAHEWQNWRKALNDFAPRLFR